MNVDAALHELAAARHGFLTRTDARVAGISKKALIRRIERGDWETHGRRVLRRTGAPWTRASPLMRAVLDAGPGAVISHTTAAAWWGLPGFDVGTVHITRPRGTTCAPAAYADRLHEVLTLRSDQVTVLDGVPIVRPERAIFELCASEHPKRAERALDAAWARALCSGTSLRRTLAELARRGRGGTVVLRDLLDARPAGWVPPASNLEARFIEIARDGMLGEWRRQVDLGDDARWCGRVDFVSTDHPVIVEVQSERYHSALTDAVHDANRRAGLEAAGFVVVEVWDTEVWHARFKVVARVRDGIARAKARNSGGVSPFLHLTVPMGGHNQMQEREDQRRRLASATMPPASAISAPTTTTGRPGPASARPTSSRSETSP
jgi:very-short-patch-repair endonuclease